MGHLNIVNQETMLNILQEGYLSTRGDLKKRVVKTTADLFSDVLALRKGDQIFPWIIGSDLSKNLGFKYVFEVAGSPILVNGEDYPIKVPLKNFGYEYEIPIPEHEALDLWEKKLLWNAIGKKSLGRGRSLTHQTPMEDERLLNLLEARNSNAPKKIFLKQITKKGTQITVNPSQNKWDNSLKKLLESLEPKDRLSNLNLSGIPWRIDKRFKVEKALEAWMMENIDEPACKEFRNLIFPKESPQLIWFGNYLPYGVQGSNIDIVLYHSGKNKKIVTIVELKVNQLNKNEFIDASQQVIKYSSFIKKAFKAFNIKVETNPIVLSASSSKHYKIQTKKTEKVVPKWITYKINNDGTVSFENVLITRKFQYLSK